MSAPAVASDPLPPCDAGAALTASTIPSAPPFDAGTALTVDAVASAAASGDSLARTLPSRSVGPSEGPSIGSISGSGPGTPGTPVSDPGQPLAEANAELEDAIRAAEAHLADSEGWSDNSQPRNEPAALSHERCAMQLMDLLPTRHEKIDAFVESAEPVLRAPTFKDDGTPEWDSAGALFEYEVEAHEQLDIAMSRVTSQLIRSFPDNEINDIFFDATISVPD
jgi:hypothetical protein